MELSGVSSLQDGYTFLSAGSENGRAGVAWLLGPQASAAWRAAGSSSHAHSSGRVLRCDLQLAGREGRWSLFSCYSPTFRSDEPTRSGFWSAVQELSDSAPGMCTYFGDFNARVGSSSALDPCSTLGPHGLGRVNDMGLAMLAQCRAQNLRIMNTFFPGPLHRKASWFHPRGRNPGLLDYCLMPTQSARLVTNVCMCPWIEVDSDHVLGIATFRQHPWRRFRPFHYEAPSAKPTPPAPRVDPSLPRKVREGWVDDVYSQMFISDVKECLDSDVFASLSRLREFALSHFGEEPKVSRPPWQEENRVALMQASQKRQRAIQRWKQRPCPATKTCLATARAASKRLCRRLFSDWWRSRAEEVAEAAATRDISRMFAGTRNLCRALGSLPKMTCPHKPLGKLSQLDSFREHFKTVLNIERPVDHALVQAHSQHVTAVEGVVWTAPTQEDISAAISRLKTRKAPGPDGLPAEVLRIVADPLSEWLFSHVQRWWSGDLSGWPSDWHSSHMVALYKGKGPKGVLDNWRGICLLPLLSKAVAMLINDRLRELGEIVLDESQVGFRPSRGCPGATFVLRRMFDEFRSTMPSPDAPPHAPQALYCLFVDLRKAFDSAPRTLLWSMLTKLGVPAGVVALLSHLHAGMESNAKLDGSISAAFPMATGVRQGATEAPTLWDLYFHFVVLAWRARLRQVFPHFGISLAGKADGDLERRRGRILASADTETRQVTDLEYADDLVSFHGTFAELREATSLLDSTITAWGGDMNLGKTKWLCIRPQGVPAPPSGTEVVLIRGHVIEEVEFFTYLGSVVSTDADLGQDRDVKARLAASGRAFGLFAGLGNDPFVRFHIKRRIFLACVRPVLTWGSEIWTMRHKTLHSIRSTWYAWVRKLLGLTWGQCTRQHISWKEMSLRAKIPDVATLIVQPAARWLGHVARMPTYRLPHFMLFASVSDRVGLFGSSPRGLCKSVMSHYRTIVRHMFGEEARAWHVVALGRTEWRRRCRTLDFVKQMGVTPFSRTGSDTLECSLCGFLSSSAQGLSRHHNLRHGLLRPSPITCTVCHRVFSSRHCLTRHMNQDHLPPPPMPYDALTCVRCGRSFGQRGHYNKHVGCHCPLQDVPDDLMEGLGADGIWPCPAPSCSATFSTAVGLGRHWSKCFLRTDQTIAAPQRIAKERVLPCQFCGSLWAFPAQRDRHEASCRLR